MRDERPMTVAEAADYLQISAEMVRRMLRQGRLEGARLGGRKLGWRIRRDALDALVEGGGLRSPGRPPKTAPAQTTAPASERHARMLAQLLAQAERARERGDAEGAARFATMLAELSGEG